MIECAQSGDLPAQAFLCLPTKPRFKPFVILGPDHEDAGISCCVIP